MPNKNHWFWPPKRTRTYSNNWILSLCLFFFGFSKHVIFSSENAVFWGSQGSRHCDLRRGALRGPGRWAACFWSAWLVDILYKWETLDIGIVMFVEDSSHLWIRGKDSTSKSYRRCVVFGPDVTWIWNSGRYRYSEPRDKPFNDESILSCLKLSTGSIQYVLEYTAVFGICLAYMFDPLFWKYCFKFGKTKIDP